MFVWVLTKSLLAMWLSTGKSGEEGRKMLLIPIKIIALVIVQNTLKVWWQSYYKVFLL